MIRKNKKISAVALAVALLGGGTVAYVNIPPHGLEGYVGKPYMDVGGIWTDCYGNTRDVSPNKIRSKKECLDLLNGEAEKIGDFILTKIKNDISVETLAAFISFTYNVGRGAFAKSTLLKKFNRGDYKGACQELFKWVYVKGKYVRGLYNRRVIEHEVCMRGLIKS